MRTTRNMTLQQLYSDETNWTKGTFARIKTTQQRIPYIDIKSNKRSSCCYCLLGGINRCYPRENRQIIENVLTRWIQNNTKHPNIPMFNDDPETTIADIQNLFKECNV